MSGTPSPGEFERAAQLLEAGRGAPRRVIEFLRRAATIETSALYPPPYARGGWRRGQSHPRARCSDDDVAMAIELVRIHGLSVKAVAEKFEVSERTVRGWLSGRTRRGT